LLRSREFKLRPRIVTVAGAGRGPLVARSLKAIARSGREAFVYAIEKNPSAYVTYVSDTLFPMSRLINFRIVSNEEKRLNGGQM